MANSDQIKALIKSHVNNEDERFVTIALQIAAHEAKLGRSIFADEIKKLIDSRKITPPRLKLFDQSVEGLVEEIPVHSRLTELVISDSLKERMERVILEYKQRGKLSKHNLRNRRKLLLAGPPGTGKSMTASIFAKELHLPFYLVNMDRLVSKYMGETSSKLRQVFEFINNNHGIYLFDEFDTIGAERLRDNDVGEMRRVLNSFLQFIERDESAAIIIAATNNPSMLDQALFRRFDDVFHYNLPAKSEVIQLIENRLGSFKGRFNVASIADNVKSLSHAEIVQACNDSIKEAILFDKNKVDKSLLLKMLKNRVSAYQK
ncbi:ATP-binding protein [uncultured Pontibacter sp.]|uniref:AAA family ATPase n=1 Tax=uncultured Pontibacter sp. TaxID=453356 RepID=UPI002635EBCC|nr:ATP-binding protein [uncultured Pontibacter sp.]